MKFHSPQNPSQKFEFLDAVLKGLAPDGHLFVPEKWPSIETSSLVNSDSVQIARAVLEAFIEDGTCFEKITDIAKGALNFQTPLVKLDENLFLLELFHGPTAAFKDVGARFLAEFMSIDQCGSGDSTPKTILVATSGDTGGAVASAFWKKKGVRVIVLYPKGKVSPLQEKQLTCWGENISALAVEGTFDDCQSLVKEAFSNKEFNKRFHLTSANSINIGRLLPQMIYYATSSMEFFKSNGVSANYVIPTGNLGNAVAALYAKKIGFPIKKVHLATNSNKTIVEFLLTGQYNPRPSTSTLANAMDVGAPSNMERLRHLYPDFETLKQTVTASSVSDEEIKESIKEFDEEFGKDFGVICPHTATAFRAAKSLPGPQIVVSTAHAAKFSEICQALINREITTPESLSKILKMKSRSTSIKNDFSLLVKFLENHTAN